MRACNPAEDGVAGLASCLARDARDTANHLRRLRLRVGEATDPVGGELGGFDALKLKPEQARRPGALEAGLEIIDLLTAQTEPLGVTDIAKRLDMDKGNAHRTLETLVRLGIVRQDGDSRRYLPGSKIMAWARQILQGRTIRDVAAPHLRQLWMASGETTHLACLNATGVVYLECLVGLGQGTTSTTLGTQAPTHCTATGKALIAGLPTIQLHAHLDAVELAPFTRNTITDKAQIIEDLAVVRQRGYATDLEEFHPGICCCASPISDLTGHVVASVGLSTPASRFVGGRAGELASMVMTAAERISRELGFALSETSKAEPSLEGISEAEAPR